MDISLKRAYLPPGPEDGLRILVERLWPRGLTKDAASIDHWCKDIAPSPDLRKWYGHEPAKWDEFQRRYRTELDGNTAEVDALIALCADMHVTFVYAAKDEARNSAVLLREYLMERDDA
jgi:uncharacterized protein YeaO (DUF488 family)